MKILELINVHTYYGESHILNGVSLQVEKGSIVALLGRNGMGKTTTVSTIIGFNPPRDGVIRFKGKEISGLPPYQICQAGIALAPQGRHIFPSLTVAEHLMIAERHAKKKDGWSLERAYSAFPILRERASSWANLMSGGEQQLLSIARALVTNPDLLLVDEPSEGLAPLIVQQIAEIISELRNEGTSVLLVEQNLSMALKISDYVYILSKGEIVYQSTPTELDKNKEVQDKFLGVESVPHSNLQ